MKAILLKEHGGPEKLTLSETPDLKPDQNNVLVRIKAAALNHLDIWVRSGSPAYTVPLPHVPGSDGAGVVEALGPNAEGVSVGDRVVIIPGISCGHCDFCRKGLDNQCDTYEIVGAKRWGTFAEQVLIPDDNLFVIPDSLSFEDAAALPVAYLTAWHMLIRKAQISKGETMLVVGGGAGVSIAAIQIAKNFGVRVLATTTKESKVAAIKKAGAAEVFIHNPQKDHAAWTQEMTNGKGAEIVMDHVGPATFSTSLKALAKYGRLVTCGSTTGPKIEFELRTVFGRDITIYGSRSGTKKEFQDLMRAVNDKKLKPLIDKTFPLAEAAEANRRMEEQQQVGKILLTV
jgi:NADPH:quinone reductase-like Zn-dependent oxidoreductase